MKILLIAGHGNGDSGAVGNGYEEATLTREFATLLVQKLNSYCDVVLANTNHNWFEFLGDNTYDFSEYDYVLEIHFNSGGGTGSEIFVTSSENGITVEEAILQNICNCVKYRNRGVKKKDFRVISKVKSQGVSSALLEVCFIDNRTDIEIYQKSKNNLADAVASGIATGFGLKKQPNENELNNFDIPEWAKNAINWCSEHNILPDDALSNINDIDDMKILLCTGLYNTVKFLAEHI